MSIEKNVQIVKSFLAALGRRDKQDLLALSAENIEWIIPGEYWPLAGTHRGHAGLNNLIKKANPEPPRVHGAGRPGSGRRLRYGEDQSHEENLRGPLGLRHYHSKWQSDHHP